MANPGIRSVLDREKHLLTAVDVGTILKKFSGIPGLEPTRATVWDYRNLNDKAIRVEGYFVLLNPRKALGSDHLVPLLMLPWLT